MIPISTDEEALLSSIHPKANALMLVTDAAKSHTVLQILNDKAGVPIFGTSIMIERKNHRPP
jgi:hypothetical protein